MILRGAASTVVVDTVGVVNQRLRVSNSARDGTSLVDFAHHGGFSLDTTVLLKLVDVVLIGDKASLTGVAVTAE